MKFGTDNKYRFTIKYPDGTTERYGTCNHKDLNDNRVIEHYDLGYLLVNKDNPDLNKWLPTDAEISWGYYDAEHDEFMPVSEFYKTML